MLACGYIAVGGGSAGCVLTHRLATETDANVLLLEAGEPDEKREISIPAAYPELFKSEVDWEYYIEPQEGLDDRELYWPRGKMLGGCSSINAMIYQRQHRRADDCDCREGGRHADRQLLRGNRDDCRSVD